MAKNPQGILSLYPYSIAHLGVICQVRTLLATELGPDTNMTITRRKVSIR